MSAQNFLPPVRLEVQRGARSAMGRLLKPGHWRCRPELDREGRQRNSSRRLTIQDNRAAAGFFTPVNRPRGQRVTGPFAPSSRPTSATTAKIFHAVTGRHRMAGGRRILRATPRAPELQDGRRILHTVLRGSGKQTVAESQRASLRARAGRGILPAAQGVPERAGRRGVQRAALGPSG